MKQKSGGKSIYLDMISFLITMFCLIVLLGSVVYFLCIKNFYTQDVIAYNEQILQESVDTYEVFLDSTIKASAVYMEQESTDQPASENMDPDAYDNTVFNRLNNIQKISDFIFSVYYLDRAQQSVYISSGLKFDRVDFYDREFLDALDDSRNYYILPARQLPTLDSGTRNVLPIVIGVPLNSSNYTGNYIINLDAGRLFTYLIRNSAIREKAVFKIIDSKNMIIASSADAGDLFQKMQPFRPAIAYTKTKGSVFASLGGREQLVSYIKSPKYDWTYVCYIDRDAVFESMLIPLHLIILVSAASLLVSVFLAIFTSKRFYRPVQDILRLFGAKAGGAAGRNEYEFIRDNLNQYLRQNRQYREIISSNRSALKKQYLYSLLTLNRYGRDEIEKKNKSFGIDLPGRCIVMVAAVEDEENYLRQYDLSSRTLLEISLENSATTALDAFGTGFFLHVETGKFALVLGMRPPAGEPEMEKAMLSLAAELRQTCESVFKMAVFIGIGRGKESPEGIHDSYKEAVKALSFKGDMAEDGIILYREAVAVTSAPIQYPVRLENELIQALLTDETEKADAALTAIFEQVRGQKRAVPLNLHIISIRLLNALAKLMMELGVSEDELIFDSVPFPTLSENLLRTASEKECLRTFHDILNGVAELIRQRRTSATREKVDRMIRYVEEHFSEALSLDILADSAGINRSYAGRIFRQYTSMSIVDYVNRIRVQKAAELLRTTHRMVGDIAEYVGFRNTNYFIQIFKKEMGETPGRYKETLKP